MIEDFDPFDLRGAPLPQAGSWPLAVPRSVTEHLKAARRAQERLRGAGAPDRSHRTTGTR